MRLSIGETVKLTGVSPRTLHYYDEIGLLAPSEITEAGYRFYDEQAIRRLQEILFYRELDFPLSEIGRILSSPAYDRNEAMRAQRELLLLKRERLDRLIRLTEETLEGGTDMGFDKFDTSSLDAARKKYAAEAEAKWGKTDAYAENKARTANYSDKDWADAQAEMDALLKEFSLHLGDDPASAPVQKLVERWQKHITDRYYTCTKEILAGLGQMYTADQRFTENMDRYGDGTASLISDAIRIYCA